MSRSPLEYEILSALRNSPRDAIAGWTLRGVVERAGVEATESEFEAACETLVQDGALDFERGGSSRKYRLPPQPDME